MKTALVAGSTGLIGSQLLALLLEDNRYAQVKAISRKPLSVSHPKLQNLVLDFDR
jgi:Predicted nucleoside-diphosphate-sugar epimerases